MTGDVARAAVVVAEQEKAGVQAELDAAQRARAALQAAQAGLRAELEAALRRAERAQAEATATRRLVGAKRRVPVKRTKFKPGPA
ncbi:hypothetical protein UB46_40690 [Burkholderiaceae bacterium 16]|nr:hypothetical protein UB46_40690 [Burkholderiaceae bacterium 16]